MNNSLFILGLCNAYLKLIRAKGWMSLYLVSLNGTVHFHWVKFRERDKASLNSCLIEGQRPSKGCVFHKPPSPNFSLPLCCFSNWPPLPHWGLFVTCPAKAFFAASLLLPRVPKGEPLQCRCCKCSCPYVVSHISWSDWTDCPFHSGVDKYGRHCRCPP